jgi:hypothetical protein
MNEHFQARLAGCIKLWNEAEGVVKQVELVQGQVLEASINELRYAGRWLVLALDAIITGKERIDDATTIDDAFTHSRLCCMQAKHDAIDALIAFLHARIDGIEDRHTHRIVAMFIHDYGDLKLAVSEVDALIVLSREHRETRIEQYDRIAKEHIPLLHKFFHSVDAAEKAMNEELERERREEEIEEQHNTEVVSGLTTALQNAKQEAADNNTKFWWSFGINVILALISG